MKPIYLFTLLYITACGAEPKKDEALKEQQANQPAIDYQPAEPTQKEIVVEYHKDGDRLALALEDTKDLPACDRQNDNQLAWIKKTEQFFVCKDEEWNEVPVKGKDGESGAKGKDGKDGKDGEKGEKGDKGDKGDPGRPVSANEWFDPITGIRWLIGSAVAASAVDSSTCSNDWRFGTRAEVKAAIQHGLSLASVEIGGARAIWTSEIADLGDGAFLRHHILSTTQEGTNAFTQGTPGIACMAVKNE